MIASLHGRVAEVLPDSAVVEIGGLGLSVMCTPATLAELRVGEPARLATALVVREDSLTLYGFADADERTVFELLQTATGVGPRLAQAMLAVHRPDALRRAVADDDLAALVKVPGVGRKVAQRLVLELKDRLGPLPAPLATPVSSAAAGWREQVHAALRGLGWSAREAEEAVAAVAEDAQALAGAGDPPQVGALLRAALRTLDRS